MTLITRLRADARLYDFPEQQKGKGRRKKKGNRLLKKDISESSTKVKWYGGAEKEITARMKKCIWYAGKEGAYLPTFAGWVQFRKDDEFILAVLGTNIDFSVKETVEWYVGRWNLEVTFREAREHLGIETQRQWSDLAITRTTPLLFCTYSLVVVIGNHLWKTQAVTPAKTAWYDKQHLTFSDLLQAVKMEIWKHRSDSREKGESEKIFSGEEALSEIFSIVGF